MQRDLKKTDSAYAAAGVDIGVADITKELIKKHVALTLRPEVLSDLGLFCGLFELKGYKEPVIVSSTDGVGTKLKVASAMGKFDTVGVDLVNHCVNDILISGADPLFFLDYIAVGEMIPQQIGELVKGLAFACQQVKCSLIGGETAQMPGFYAPGDCELAGFIVGCVEKKDIIKYESIGVGDVVLGLPSSGIHTNGYSLVRSIFEMKDSVLNTVYLEFGRTLGEELLEPHRCYYNQLKPVLRCIKGMAHITGGGFGGNIPRILPQGLCVKLRKNAWIVPPIFKLIEHQGKIEEEEMYRVFNMGIGMVVICAQDDVSEVCSRVEGIKLIGEVITQTDERRVIIG